jgi:glycosyltransferase involved in cell wall biosynthesis
MRYIFILCLTGSLLTILNALSMRIARLRISTNITDLTSVLVPMRNEERNVEELVKSITGSKGLRHWEFIVLDDASIDSTKNLLEKERKTREFTCISGEALPPGWLGKLWACEQLAAASKGHYLVFVDADVRLSSGAISSAIDYMNELNWDFISPHPRQIAVTFLERLFQPLLQWSWLASVPLRLAERLGIPSMTIANGQFFLVKRSAYLAIGGHQAIKDQVLDDLQLARKLVRSGFKGGIAEASELAQTRMYTTSTELINGYTKSLWTAFGGIAGTVFAIALLTSTQVIPLIFGLTGSALGWAAYFTMALSHGIAALRTKNNFANIFLHPLSTFLLILLILESFRRKITGTLIWRERILN